MNDFIELVGERTADVEVRYVVAPIVEVDVRDAEGNHDGTWTMSGYAAVFNQSTTLYDGKFARITEQIAPQAFDTVLREQGMNTADGVVHFNFNHDMSSAVAATDVPAGEPGSLILRADPKGLYFMAKVARDDPDGVRLASKLRTGVVKQASFAFTVAKDEIISRDLDDGRTEEHRTIQGVKRLYDVTATPQGAYPQTVSQLRSYAAAIGQPVGPEAVEEATPVTTEEPEPTSADNVGGEARVKPRLDSATLRKIRSHKR